MKLSARMAVSAVLAALVLSSLVAVPPACAMSKLGSSVAESAGDCCPSGPVKVAADCCKPTIAPATVPSRLAERPLVGASALVAALGDAAQPPALVVVVPAAAGAPPVPLDSLAQSCILRI